MRSVLILMCVGMLVGCNATTSGSRQADPEAAMLGLQLLMMSRQPAPMIQHAPTINCNTYYYSGGARTVCR